MKKSAIAAALALGVNIGIADAIDMNSGVFDMLSATGGTIGNFPDVTGNIGGGTWFVQSTSPFFGFPWTAHDGVTFGPGTYDFDTIQGGIYTGVVVGAGQVGGHILFDWNGNFDIDVVNVWDVTDNGDGTVTYTSTDGPATNPVNPDGVRGYGMLDGAFGGSNANFDFIISAPPTANDDSKSTVKDTPVNIDLAVNDSAAATTAAPPDEKAVIPAAIPPASLTVDAVSTQGGTISQPAPADGTVDYTPPAGFTGADTFTYTLTDDAGRESSSATVTVTVTLVVNNPPVASDTTVTTDEDTPLAILVNGVASDPDNDPLTFKTFDAGTANGATITEDGTKTVLTYTPAQDFNGADSFSYSVTDGIDDSNVATITVIVDPVNDALQCQDVETSTSLDTPLEIDAAKDLLSTCTDVDNDPISLVTVGNPSQPGSTTAYDGANTVTYTPADGFEGNDKFTYTATDGTDVETKNVKVAVSSVIYGNFTMIDASGSTFGGTNDIVANWDGTLNTAVTDTNFNMTIESDSTFPFFGFPWFAHDIRAFGPGTYEFDTSCTVAQLQAGTADCGGTPAEMLELVVPAGMTGAHVLFDWNVTEDIDVVLVWANNGSFDSPPPGALYQGPAGSTPAVDAIFELVSRDADGDGVPGAKMIDGPFIDFSANFNLNFTQSSGGGEVTAPQSSISSPSLGNNGTGCALSNNKTNGPLQGGDWLAVLGFMAMLGFARNRKQRKKLQ